MTYAEFKEQFLPEFLNITSYAGRIRYAKENLQGIGSGTGRAVFDIDDEHVLKLAKNAKDIAQNEAENNASYRDTDHVVAKVIDASDNYEWLISEKAKKVTQSRIKELTDIPSLNDLFFFLRNYEEISKGHKKVYGQEPEMEEFFWDNEFAYDLANFIANYGQNAGDMGRPSTYGEVLRDGQPAIVLTDYGLNDEVYDTHYNPTTKARYQMYELYNYADGNDDILTDAGGGAGGNEIRTGMWAQMPYSVSDGGDNSDAVINEEFVNFVSNRDKYPDKPINSLPELTDHFHECVNNISETLKTVDNKKQFYENLLKLQEYIIRRGFYNREPLMSESYVINEEVPSVEKDTLSDRTYGDELAKQVAGKLGLSTPKYLGGGANGFAYEINNEQVLKLTADISEADAASKLIRGNPKYISAVYGLYKVVDNTTNKAFFAILQENINDKPVEKIKRNQEVIREIKPDGLDYDDIMVMIRKPKKFDYQAWLEFAKKLIMDNPQANVTRSDRQAAYQYLVSMLNIRNELIEFGIKSTDYITIDNLGYKNGVLKYFDVGGYYGIPEPQLSDKNLIQLPEDGSAKFSTSDGVNQDGFPTYNQGADTSPSINNSLDANTAMYEDLEYNHVDGDATKDEYKLEERDKSYGTGSKAVEVKKKCQLGGNGDGTSTACNQGDINNLKFSSIKEMIQHEIKEYFSLNEVGEGNLPPYEVNFFKNTEYDKSYSFATEDGDIYLLQFNRNDLDENMWDVVFSVGGSKDRYGDINYSEVTNKGRQYRVMSTILKVMKGFFANTKPDMLVIQPSKTKGDFDDRRFLLYLSYIKKHLPTDYEMTQNSIEIVIKKKGLDEYHSSLVPQINEGEINEVVAKTQEEVDSFISNSKVKETVYHGSPVGGLEDIKPKGGGGEGQIVSSSGLREDGMYFTSNPELAEIYKSGRQLTPEFKSDVEYHISVLRDRQNSVRNNREYYEYEAEIEKLRKKLVGDIYGVKLKITNPLIFDAKGKTNSFTGSGWDELEIDLGYKIARGKEAVRMIAEKNSVAKDYWKYDGIIGKNIIDMDDYGGHTPDYHRHYNGNVYVVFSSNQILILDPEMEDSEVPVAQDLEVRENISNIASMNEAEIMSLQDLPFKQEVEKLGGKIFSVGGAVRDEFLGKESKDLDILITGIPMDKLEQLLSKYGSVNTVGKSFGVIKFVPKGATEEIDIAIPRTETATGGGGHKDFNVTSDHELPIEKDLERRDFTINAIGKDSEGNLVDPYGGQQDLKDKIIRVVNPVAFSDDPLRMLRAVQFASRFGFVIEPTTMDLIKTNAEKIKEIPPERILIEFDKIVKKGDKRVGAQLLQNTGLFNQIFGYDLKPSTIERSDFEGVKTMGEFLFLLTRLLPQPAEFVKDNLKADIQTYKQVKALQLAYAAVNETNITKARTAAHNVYVTSKDMLQSQILPEVVSNAAQDLLAGKYPKSIGELAVNGNDLMILGLQGKEIGDALKNMLVKIYGDEIRNNKEELLSLVQKPENLKEGDDRKEKVEYGALMLLLDIPKWEKITSSIKKDDVYEVNGEFGIETEPHVTILYGFHNNVNNEEVFETYKENFGLKPIEIEVKGISLFENEEFDVVKMDVDSKILAKMNSIMRDLPNTNTYPKYHAHITIAYVKKGSGKKYVKNFEKNHVLIGNELMFSTKKEKKNKLELGEKGILKEGMRRVSYSAVVLDDQSREKLVKVFKPMIPEDWEIIAHHMTIKMGALDDGGQAKEDMIGGQVINLNVVDFAIDDLVMAVGVEGYSTTNTKPHITIAVNRAGGGKPFFSNKLTDWKSLGFPLKLTGTVKEQ